MSLGSRISTVLAVLLALMLATPVLGQSVYKWTDENGLVHYSDQPPPDRFKAERLQMRSLTVQREEARGDDSEVTDPDAEDGDEPASRESPACASARHNLVVLENNDIVRMDLDGDGTAEELTQEQREAELIRTRELIALLCR
jgi:hypothetical protein